MKNVQSVLLVMTLLLAATLLVASCAGPEAGRAPAAGAGQPPIVAETLESCLALIPKDATAGQRALAEQSCEAKAAARGTVVKAGTAAATSAAASGTAGDSLEACLSRIPGDASAGQRMIAEQSCRRDEAARAAIAVVPSR